MAIARSLVNGQGFANPFGYTTGPTAAYTPVHPLMLAAILYLRGDRPAAALRFGANRSRDSNALRGAASLYRGGRVRLLDSRCDRCCGLLLCTWPLPQWESSTAWLAFEAVFLCALVGVRWGWTGAVMGLGWLVSPALGPASLAVVWLLRGRKYVIASAAIAIDRHCAVGRAQFAGHASADIPAR